MGELPGTFDLSESPWIQNKEALEKANQTMKKKIDGWLKNPGLLFLCYSYGLRLLALREDEKLEGKITKETVETVASRALAKLTLWEKTKKEAKPYIVLWHHQPYEETQTTGLIFKKKEKYTFPEEYGVKFVTPYPDEGCYRSVTLLMREGFLAILIKSKTSYSKVGEEDKPPAFPPEEEYLLATVDDFKFFDEKIEEPPPIYE